MKRHQTKEKEEGSGEWRSKRNRRGNRWRRNKRERRNKERQKKKRRERRQRNLTSQIFCPTSTALHFG